MSYGIASILTEVLARSAGAEATGSLQVRAVGGGSINNAYQITTKQQQHWFCKINDARAFPDLFVLERQGLALLERTGAIRVPQVIACEVVAGKQVLVMEWIGEGQRSGRFWTRFGSQLAQLHQATGTHFGLSVPGPGRDDPHAESVDSRSAGFGASPVAAPNNYMGSLPQSNVPAPEWNEFFRDQRMHPQVKLAMDNGLLGAAEVRHFQGLYKVLDTIFEKEPPSLLHGDLWSGNFLCDEQERPVLIDPAVYYGHRSMDLAMTTLFGGFEQSFYEAYAWHHPFPSNYRQQWDICNLYPLLVHLNLFGKSYLRNILHTIQGF
jgi:fructosamine-3-kinase